MNEHDRRLASAFDQQAKHFESRPVHSNPALLARLVRFAGLAPGLEVVDAGCGPGLVSQAFLAAGHRVCGIDLSAEMIDRARKRCQEYGGRGRFIQASLFDPAIGGPFDAAVSRFVLHHVVDAEAFIRRQVELLRPGGILVVCDHTTDPDPERAAWHQEIERARDCSHVRCLAPGQIVDLVAALGLRDIRLEEEAYLLDFDEWFDRGTPAAAKQEVRQRLLAGPHARGFQATLLADDSVQMQLWLAMVRGVKPPIGESQV
jgi:SAM-dependent methyltransferase